MQFCSEGVSRHHKNPPSMAEKSSSIGEGDPLEPSSTSLFPVFNTKPSTIFDPNPRQDSIGDTSGPGWLCNTSFIADLSIINDAIVSRHDHYTEPEEEHEPVAKLEERQPDYKLLVSSASDEDPDRSSCKSKKKDKRKRRKRNPNDYNYGPSSRKQSVQSWANEGTISSANKEYYFDSHGDRDNLAFGSLYRMDVARYKLCQGTKSYEFKNYALNNLNRRSWAFDEDNDVNALDNKLRTEGRYSSAKYAALEHHKDFKRLKLVASKEPAPQSFADFIPLSDEQTLVEESWQDEMLRKTRDFNKMTREQPYNDKLWLEFADFQDKVANLQPQRGARLQTLEKKISILEKAVELNLDNEELLIALMNAYQRKDNNEVLIDRWEKLLISHSGSYKLWREFLRLVQGDFSRFKISEIRKMFANAIHDLSAACSKQDRQAHQNARLSADPLLVQQELGLVDIFVSLCRFEWQAGYREMATALFQAEVEFSLFCPSLLLSKQGKQRLFEHFWNSGGARIGEDGALGWSTWLEKEEAHRQNVMIKESSSSVDEGGWTGWYEPKTKVASENEENTAVDEERKTDDMDLNDDTEALMKLLGIDAETEANDEVQDVSTLVRWSEEELSRDSNQWMPVRTDSGNPVTGQGTDEGDEQLLRAALFEDISEYLFSVTTEEARLSLVYQLIEFFGGRIPQWSSTNSSSWAEQTLTSESLPDFILDDLRKIQELLRKTDSCQSSYSLEKVIDDFDNIHLRSEMMKFVRNATLQCLNAFPRDHILKEAALVAEELSNTRINSCSSANTPCRALAKSLLKCNRQDVYLCGVYAKREAAFGNIEHARKAFEMALSSIEGLPRDTSLLYLWYVEVELASSSSGSSESLTRAMHILYCLGCGIKYTSFKSRPSSLQLLRARQEFKQRIKTIYSTWIRGVIDDNSIAFICCAALFEELTTGWEAGIEVLNQALSMVLPEKRSQTYQLEFLFNFYVSLLWKQSNLANVWKSVMQGLQDYPFSPKLHNAVIQIGYPHTSAFKLRRIIDDYLRRKPSVTLCLFALSYEMRGGGSQHRVHRIFERALADNVLRNSVLLWRLYMSYEIHIASNLSAARKIYFRAIHTCPWSKRLWLDGFMKLSSVMSVKELSDLVRVMRDKELNVRTDVYEILLQDEIHL